MEAKPVSPGVSGQSVASMVLGILSCVGFSVFAGIPALILGVLELRKIRGGQSALSGRPFAIAGIATASFSTVTTLLFLAMTLWFQNLVMRPMAQDLQQEIDRRMNAATSPAPKAGTHSGSKSHVKRAPSSQ